MPKTYRHKVCSLCGKSEGMNWARHWKNQHPAAVIKELVPGDIPCKPFDDSWLYLIKPETLRDLYMSPAKIDEVSPTEAIERNQVVDTLLNID